MTKTTKLNLRSFDAESIQLVNVSNISCQVVLSLVDFCVSLLVCV